MIRILCLQVMHDYVVFHCSIDYTTELIIDHDKIGLILTLEWLHFLTLGSTPNTPSSTSTRIMKSSWMKWPTVTMVKVNTSDVDILKRIAKSFTSDLFSTLWMSLAWNSVTKIWYTSLVWFHVIIVHMEWQQRFKPKKGKICGAFIKHFLYHLQQGNTCSILNGFCYNFSTLKGSASGPTKGPCLHELSLIIVQLLVLSKYLGEFTRGKSTVGP